MGRKTNHSRNMATKFRTNLVAGLLNQRRLEKRTPLGKEPFQETDKTERGAVHVQAPPKTKYTNAKGAAEYLGLSKASFCRLKAKGFFQPSPITRRYHLDDLDREARGTLSRPNGGDAADSQTQKTFGDPESMPPLAHGGSLSTVVSLE